MLGFFMLRVPRLHGRYAFVRVHCIAIFPRAGKATPVFITPKLVRTAFATFKLKKRILTRSGDFAARLSLRF
jgi:hypothetical protein